MTEVYVMYQIDAEPHEDINSGVHNIFSSEKSALEYLERVGKGPHWIEEEFQDGYYLSSELHVFEVL